MNYFIVPGLKIKVLTFETIEKEICNFFNIATIQIDSRKKEIVQARQLCHYFARKYFKKAVHKKDKNKINWIKREGMASGEIGKYFGDKDHATVLHSIKTVENDMLDKNYKENVIKLNKLFNEKYITEKTFKI